jgi:hypothetical protein
MRVIPEAGKLKGEDLDPVTPDGNPARLTETIPENPLCGTRLRFIDAVELADIVKLDGLAPIENDGGGGGGGEELPLPQLPRPTTRISSAGEMTALLTFTIDVPPAKSDDVFKIHNAFSVVAGDSNHKLAAPVILRSSLSAACANIFRVPRWTRSPEKSDQ